MAGAQDLAQAKAGLDNVETRARHPRRAHVRRNLAVARLKQVARPEERSVELV